MKKLLLLIAILVINSFTKDISAQCTISDLKVSLININTTNCEFTFDFSWTQEVNSGNKFSYLHMWTTSGYHTPAANWVNMYKNPTAYPVAADLVNVITTVVIDENSSDNPLIGTVYHPDSSFVLQLPTNLSVVKVHLNNTLIERMTIRNVKVIIPNCTGAQTIKFDIWASQAANGKNVHCVSQGANLVINEVKTDGVITCVLPRQFQVFIENTGPVLDNIQYDVHLDYAPYGIINPTDTVVFVSDVFQLPANGIYTSPVMGYLPYSNRNPSVGLPLIVEVTVPLRSNTTIAKIVNNCGIMPIKFSSFFVQQLKDRILLNWQTEMEQNSKGFEVQRKQGSGDFKTIAFVPSQALYGNSNQLLNYIYEDIDNQTLFSQIFYRIKQVDLDGNSSLSEIRFIKNNLSKITVLVYPNPSNGKAKISLSDRIGPVDIKLIDMNGREIKEWFGIINQLQLDIAQPGFYILKVLLKDTGEMHITKIIVQ